MSNSHPLRGDIYWAELKPVKGSEQGGFRPVLIVSNNLMNEKAPIVSIIPMTTEGQKVAAGPFNIVYKVKSLIIDQGSIDELKTSNILSSAFDLQDGVLLCNQARVASKQRLIKRIAYFSDRSIFANVKNALNDVFALSACKSCDYPIRPDGLVCVKCGTFARTKCIQCSHVFDISYNFCPNCGRGVSER